MSKRITMNEVMEALNNINKRLDALENKSKPTTTTKGSATASKKSAKVSTDIKDYEPKKSADGNYNWKSYKSKRTDYCYAVATKGEALCCLSSASCSSSL